MRFLLSLVLALAVLGCQPPAAASEPFAVAARGAVLIDAESGRILYAQNANAMLPMASTTKIMTALLALERARLDEAVTAGKNASGVPGTSLYLSEGETLSMEHMLYGLMLRSGNDAAIAVAEHISGSVSAFAELMNDRAEALGADAHFVNPHGLDAPEHRISALGLALVLREAMKNTDFRRITGTQRKVIPWIGNEYSRVLENKNRLLKTYEGANGGKTGYTGKAGRCLAFSAERNGLGLIGAVLNCPTWFDTAAALLDYGFENYRAMTSLEAGQQVCEIPVRGGVFDSVPVVAGERLYAAVPVGEPSQTVSTLPESLEAPVAAHSEIGIAEIKTGGRTIARCRLIAARSIPRRSFLHSVKNLLRWWVLRFDP